MLSTLHRMVLRCIPTSGAALRSARVALRQGKFAAAMDAYLAAHRHPSVCAWIADTPLFNTMLDAMHDTPTALLVGAVMAVRDRQTEAVVRRLENVATSATRRVSGLARELLQQLAEHGISQAQQALLSAAAFLAT